jgi:hypothetical protein
MEAEHKMARRIQLRRDTAAAWAAANPVLGQGEIGLDLTNRKIKIGDGATAWNTLTYWDDKETDFAGYATTQYVDDAIGAITIPADVSDLTDTTDLLVDLSAVDQHIVPTVDSDGTTGYTLGSPTKKWKELFVSNGSVYIGNVKLSNNAGTLKAVQVTDPGLVTEAEVAVAFPNNNVVGAGTGARIYATLIPTGLGTTSWLSWDNAIGMTPSTPLATAVEFVNVPVPTDLIIAFSTPNSTETTSATLTHNPNYEFNPNSGRNLKYTNKLEYIEDQLTEGGIIYVLGAYVDSTEQDFLGSGITYGDNNSLPFDRVYGNFTLFPYDYYDEDIDPPTVLPLPPPRVISVDVAGGTVTFDRPFTWSGSFRLMLGRQATATYVLEDNVVTEVTVLDPGWGYGSEWNDIPNLIRVKETVVFTGPGEFIGGESRYFGTNLHPTGIAGIELQDIRTSSEGNFGGQNYKNPKIRIQSTSFSLDSDPVFNISENGNLVAAKFNINNITGELLNVTLNGPSPLFEILPNNGGYNIAGQSLYDPYWFTLVIEDGEVTPAPAIEFDNGVVFTGSYDQLQDVPTDISEFTDTQGLLGGSGSGDTLTNSTQTFSLDEAGNAVFSGEIGGVNRGLVWDYGAEVGGENSTVRQDQNGLTVRAWTEFRGEEIYSAPVNIVTNEDANEKRWTFDGDGDLTLPPGGDILDSNGNSVLGGGGTAVDQNIWVQTFETDIGADDIPILANSVEYDSEGNVIALFVHSVDGASYYSVGKYTTTGAKIWTARFGDSFDTDGWGLAVDNDSNSIYVAGQSEGEGGQNNATLTKLDGSDGSIVWSKIYDFGFDSDSPVVDVASDGNPVMVGYASNGSDNYVATTKIDEADGSIIWSRSLDGQGDEQAFGMAVGPTGEVVSIGWMDQLGADDSSVLDDRMLVVKYNSAGAIQWQKAIQFDADFDCYGSDADIDSDGNIYVTGNYQYYDSDNDTNTSALSILKLDSTGAKQWSRRVVGDCDTFSTSVVVGPDDKLYLSGVTGNNNNNDYTWVAAKYGFDGAVEWQRLIDNTDTWSFGGFFFFESGSGSNIAVKQDYVVLGGGFGFLPSDPPNAAVVQVSASGDIFSVGDWDFKAASFSGVLNGTASDITVVNAGKTDTDNSENITTTTAELDTEVANFLIGTLYRASSVSGDTDRLVNGEYQVVLDSDGDLTLPVDGDLIIGEDGRWIKDCGGSSGTTSMRWINVPVDNDSTQLIRVYSGDPDGDGDSNERAQIRLNWLDEDRSGLTIRAYDRTDSEDTVTHNWTFQGDGDLVLPEGGDIKDSNGDSVLGGSTRVKLTSPGDRRIEEVYGYKEVSVTAPSTVNLTTTASRDSDGIARIWVDSTTTTIDEILNDTTAAGITDNTTIEFSVDNINWYRWGGTSFDGDERGFVVNLNGATLTYSLGDTVYFRYEGGGAPVVWWDKNELPGGSSDFRGAVIDYHAYTGESTIIGTIHIVDDDGEEHITHTEVQSGSTDGENDDLWLVTTEGQIKYRRIDQEEKTLKIQWSAKVFYGSELYD